MSEFTARQQVAMSDRVAEAAKHGVSMAGYRDWGSSWHGRFEPESRPGRGQDFNGVWCDGEHLVQVAIDVYGNGYMSIATVNWQHISEDCECEICEKEREDEL